jgi:hypothetical protein
MGISNISLLAARHGTYAATDRRDLVTCRSTGAVYLVFAQTCLANRGFHGRVVDTLISVDFRAALG